jgi:hypothetical protein
MSIVNANLLKTTQIQHPNGSSALTIDSNGRVSLPNTVGFWAVQYSNGGTVAAGKYTFEATIYNRGSGYNTGTSRFTAPAAGLYYFIATLELYSLSVASGISFYKNGSVLPVPGNGWPVGQSGAIPDHEIMTSSAIVEMAVNDYIEVYTVNGARGMQSQWLGYLIG